MVDKINVPSARAAPFATCLLLIVTFLYGAASIAADTNGSRMAEAWWRDRFAEKRQALRDKPVRLVFLGDSIFQSFEWDRHAPQWNRWYGGRDAIDLGFNGDGWANVLWRVQHGELDGASPRLVVILIGTNDLWQPNNQIVDGIADLLKAVSVRLPAAQLLVLGILPSGKSADEQATARAVNARLSAMYGEAKGNVRYDDVSCVFQRNGKLNDALFREPAVPGMSSPLHPTPLGMDLLAARIEPIVAAALGDRPRGSPDALALTDCSAGH